MKIITLTEYEALTDKAKGYFVPVYSRYKTITDIDTCYECGHKTKNKTRVPAKNAKIIEYHETIFNIGLWQTKIAELAQPINWNPKK
jgi:hypothetical protein